MELALVAAATAAAHAEVSKSDTTSILALVCMVGSRDMVVYSCARNAVS